MESPARLNNFDLIRLAAALQVVLVHVIEHLQLQAPPFFIWLLGSFPGVPIFFVVSGYLVTASYRRSRSASAYFVNRALRIFPGLWVCFAFTLFSIAVLHGFHNAGRAEFLVWIVTNLLGLSHTPPFLKHYATGSVNGSLWTIPVELQFYLTLPLLLVALRQSARRWVVAFALCLSLGLMYLFLFRANGSSPWAGWVLRVLPSWLYLFMLGMILEWRSDWVRRYMASRLATWLVGYLIWIGLLALAGFNTTGNDATPLALLPLSCLVLAAAYTRGELASWWLRDHDLSYGIYLYHMPILNVLVTLSPVGWGLGGLVVCIIATLVLSALSWLHIERPALRLKAKASKA